MIKIRSAGAGFHDLIGFYLGFSASGQNIWRFENQQERIQRPYYGPDFQQNSTIMHAKDINTPLLLFAGTEDTQVDWTQSRELQVALWRLGKKSTLLVYPGEGHGLNKESNQLDITMRVKTWFDYYLKGGKPADWILSGENHP